MIDDLFGQMLVEVAKEELGHGESGGNNRGPDVERYRWLDGTHRPVNTDDPWCASFASFCLLQACERLAMELPFKTSRGAKHLIELAAEAGQVITEPQIGALICWHNSILGPLSRRGHIGIICDWSEESRQIAWIDGNGASANPLSVAKVSLVTTRFAPELGKNGWRKRLYMMVAL